MSDLPDASAPSSSIDSLKFDNKTLKCLPIDPELCTHEQAKTDKAKVPRDTIARSCFSLTWPTAVLDPVLVSFSQSALALLDLPPKEATRPEFVQYFSGCKVIPGAQPAAHTYCGYQFGNFSGQLGDGAAMYLGEVENPKTDKKWEIQLKGSGMTPYSRKADGRKVLRSSIREYLCSEAMHALGVPTTRAASCITSSTRVVRDIFYTGNNIEERCTVVLRLAQTFLRFGSFEIFKAEDARTGRAGPSAGLENEVVMLGMDGKRQGPFLQTMVDFVISAYFPEILAAHREDGDKTGCYAAFVKEVVERTARLAAHWQAVGFCHGVLNTDNMSIVGVTLDYGPFGFMERFDPDWACNHSDDGGRYSYAKQRDVCRWNCEKLADSLRPLFAGAEAELEEAVGAFDAAYERWWLRLFRRKLGLVRAVELEERVERAEAAEQLLRLRHASFRVSEGEVEEAVVEAEAARKAVAGSGLDKAADAALIHDLLHVMAETGADFSDTFRGLLLLDDLRDGTSTQRFLAWLLPRLASPAQMAKACTPRMPFEQLQMLLMLARQSPALLQQVGVSVDVLMAELRLLERRKALGQMTAEEKRGQDKAAWSAWLGRYWQRLLREPAVTAAENKKTESLLGGANAGRKGLETVDDRVIDQAQRKRSDAMRASNPHTVLRNSSAQAAIERAEEGDFAEVTRLLALLADPFSQDLELAFAFKWDRRATDRQGRAAEVTCQWLNHKLLPPNETLTIILPSFTCGKAGAASDTGRTPLELAGTHVSQIRAEWDAGRLQLTVLGEALKPGEHVVITLPPSNLLYVPDSGVTWQKAMEDPVPLEGGWYQLILAEEYKQLPSEAAAELCVSCSS